MKIIATDGEGEDAAVDVVSKTLVVNEGAEDGRIMTFVIAAISLVGILGLIAFAANSRRKKMAELDMIESWDAFGQKKDKSPDQTTEGKAVPELESGLTDSAHEVEAEEASIPEIEEAMLEQKPKQELDLDWDNV